MVKKNTIKDVAKEAGVSIATVSFVLNDTPGQAISDKVRKKVEAAAKKLDYHPSAAASGLARKRTGNITIMFYRREDLISNHYYSFVVQGAVKEAMLQGFNLLFSYIDSEYLKNTALPKVVREKNTEGVIFIHEIEPRLVRDIESRGIPVVAVDNYPEMDDLAALSADDVQGGRLAVSHLAELGHTQVSVVFSAEDRPSIRGRLHGYREAAAEHGITLREVRCEELTFEAGYAETRKLLLQRNRPTAIIGINDEMAAGAIRAVHSLGLEVPDDVSIVGFDNIMMGNYTAPSLTTIGTDKEALGARAVVRLAELIKNKKSPRTQETLSVSLVARDSTGNAPER